MIKVWLSRGVMTIRALDKLPRMLEMRKTRPAGKRSAMLSNEKIKVPIIKPNWTADVMSDTSKLVSGMARLNSSRMALLENHNEEPEKTAKTRID